MDPAWDEAAPEAGKPRATRKKKSRMVRMPGTECGLGGAGLQRVQVAYRFGPLRLQGRLPSTITLEELSSW